jgi:hypothetical protein
MTAALILPPDLRALLDRYRQTSYQPRYLYIVRASTYSPGASVLVAPQPRLARGNKTQEAHARHMGRAYYRAARAIAGMSPAAPHRGRETLVTLPSTHPLYSAPLPTPDDIAHELRTLVGPAPLPPDRHDPAPPPDPAAARPRRHQPSSTVLLVRPPSSDPEAARHLPPVAIRSPGRRAPRGPEVASLYVRAMDLVRLAGGGSRRTPELARQRGVPRLRETIRVGASLAAGEVPTDYYVSSWWVDLTVEHPVAVWVGPPPPADPHPRACRRRRPGPTPGAMEHLAPLLLPRGRRPKPPKIDLIV